MQDHDDLEIPAFLRRSKDEAPKAMPPERKPRKRKLTAKEEREREVRRIADRRWRIWTPSPETGLRRPRITTIRKQVRKELARIDAKLAARQQ